LILTNIKKYAGYYLKYDTWGFLAIANFLICALSDIFLVSFWLYMFLTVVAYFFRGENKQ